MNLSDYITSDIQIDSSKIQEVALRIRTVMKEFDAELDTTPSSPFGNLVITPLAKIIATYEQVNNCILSDINLANALSGKEVCDCDFTEAFIKGLGLDTLLSANTTSILRIQFNTLPSNSNLATEVSTGIGEKTAKAFIIDTGTSFVFDEEYLFHPYAPYSGQIQIFDPNIEIDYSNSNKKILSIGSLDQGTGKANMWYIDIPIYGPSTANLTADAVPTSDINASYLDVDGVIPQNGILLMQDVIPYETPTSIINLAKLAQTIYPSANFSTKGGIVSFLKKKFPTLSNIVPVTSNDLEGRQITQLDALNPTTLDIYIKSYSNFSTCTEYIKFTNSTSSGNTYTAFSLGKEAGSYLFHPQHTIFKIQSAILHYVDDTNTLQSKEIDSSYLTLTSTASKNINTNNLPKANTCGTKFEEFQIEVTVAPGITLKNILDGEENIYDYVYLELNYLYDLNQNAVGDLINSPECVPFIDTINKQFYNCAINSLNIYYTKKSGTYVDRQSATSAIYDFINNLSYPYVYNDAYITDIMILNGAVTVSKIEPIAQFSFSAANYFKQKDTDESFSTILIDGSSEYLSTLSEEYIQNRSNDSNNNWKDQSLSIGTRNIGYYLPIENIHLIETII